MAHLIEEEFRRYCFKLGSQRRENMLRNTSLIVCMALAALAAGCSNTPAPPTDTRAADVQAVKDVEAAWNKDIATKDADKFASYFAEDGCALYPGAGTLDGKAAIKAAMAQYFADPNSSWTSQDTRAVASKGGDMVYVQGTYSMTMTNPKTKKPMTDKGKYLTIYGKQADGSWKVVADTFNSDSPM
jgi:uncharacterized protein (TIGR02246 family)